MQDNTQQLRDNNYFSNNAGDTFVGYDTTNNPIYKHYNFSGDAKYTARSEEAANLNNWNMMLYQNDYNDPANQLQRLVDAGLNPLYYLGGNAGTLPASNGGNAQGHSMTSASGEKQQAIEASKNVADTLLQTQRQAQEYDLATKQMNLESRRIDIEQGKLDLEAAGGSEYDRAYKQSMTDYNYSNIGVNEAKIDQMAHQNDWTDAQTAQAKSQTAVLDKELAVMGATINELNSRTSLNKASEAKVYEEAAVIADTRWSEVEKLAAEADLTRQEYFSEVKKTVGFMLDNDQKEINLKVGNEQYVKLKKENERITFELNQDMKFDSYERQNKMVTDLIRSGVSAVSAGIGVQVGKKVVKAMRQPINPRYRGYYNSSTNTYSNPY